MATLIVLLPLESPGPGLEYAYVLSSDGLAVLHQGRASAAQLPLPVGASHDIVAIAPARACSWHQVTLPPRLPPGPQLRTALQGLLEEELLDEAPTLHLALGPAGPGPRWVAACDRAWLRAHLQALEEARRPVTRLLPEYEPLTDEPARLHVTAGLDPAQLVRVDSRGVTVLPLDPAAVQWLAWPEDAPLWAEPGVATAAEAAFQRPVTVQTAAERWLGVARSAWNMAQFEFTRSPHTQILQRLRRGWRALRHEPQWRAARWLIVLLLGSQFIGLQALAWKEGALLAEKRQAQRDILLQTFPEIPVVLDAPRQMERQLGLLLQTSGTATARDFDTMLMALSSAAPGPLAPQGIAFQAGQTRLQGLTLSALEIATLSARLQTLGYALRAEGPDWLIEAGGRP